MLLRNIDIKKNINNNIELYGFKLNQNESDPSSMVSYIGDNLFYTPAHMDFDSGKFDYGDWQDAFFMKMNPCMVNYSGEVDYYLDQNDYSKKLNGEESDISNIAYQGNAMIQVPKIYWKIIGNRDTAEVYISNKKLDDGFECWSHINNQGKEIDFCYMPIYNGSLINDTLRSLSGQTPMTLKNAQAEINYAKANNKDNNILWYTTTFSDWMLINLLLILISKTVDNKTAFGRGNNSSTYVDSTNTGILNTGIMDNKGLFWGTADNKSGVKVFGMEHWWGNIWKRIAGYVNDRGIQKIKLTYNQKDGSFVDGYNLDGSGYLSIPNSACVGNGGYCNSVICDSKGLLPLKASGSATTYFCSGLWFDDDDTQNNYALVGGGSSSGARVGGLFLALDDSPAVVYWNVGASPSLKPLT